MRFNKDRKEPADKLFGNKNFVTKTWKYVLQIINFPLLYGYRREHWKGEVSADEWVPVFPGF